MRFNCGAWLRVVAAMISGLGYYVISVPYSAQLGDVGVYPLS